MDKNAIAEAWIRYNCKDDLERVDEDTWADDELANLPRKDPDLCWDTILLILGKIPADPSAPAFRNLAAGPLEEFLVQNGEEYIDLVEERASIDSSFQLLLGGVWKDNIENSVWQRIEAVRGKCW